MGDAGEGHALQFLVAVAQHLLQGAVALRQVALQGEMANANSRRLEDGAKTGLTVARHPPPLLLADVAGGDDQKSPLLHPEFPAGTLHLQVGIVLAPAPELACRETAVENRVPLLTAGAGTMFGQEIGKRPPLQFTVGGVTEKPAVGGIAPYDFARFHNADRLRARDQSSTHAALGGRQQWFGNGFRSRAHATTRMHSAFRFETVR